MQYALVCRHLTAFFVELYSAVNKYTPLHWEVHYITFITDPESARGSYYTSMSLHSPSAHTNLAKSMKGSHKMLSKNYETEAELKFTEVNHVQPN